MSVPKLRFKREDGTDYPEWKKQRIGDLFYKVNERNNGQFDKTKWISVAKMYYQMPDKVTSNNIDTRTYVMRLGDMAFEGHPNSDFLFGRFVVNDIGDGVISELFPIYRHKTEYVLKYWKYAIQIEKVMAHIYRRSITSSGASSNKLNDDDFQHESICVPCLEEQQKIADFLSTIDEVIAQSESEVQNLEQQKKAAMQKIFSQEVRFKREDGSEYPKWRTTRLYTYLFENKDRNINNDYGKQDVLSVSGEFGVVNQIEFQGRSFAGADVSLYHILYSGDIVYTKSPLKANPYGIIKYNQGVTGIVSTLYAVYHCKSNVDGRFIEYYFDDDLILNKYLKPLVNIGSKHDMKINNEYALSGNVCFPCLEEQQKIADFLSAYDEAIRYAKQELDKWKELKKGLLQQMFV